MADKKRQKNKIPWIPKKSIIVSQREPFQRKDAEPKIMADKCDKKKFSLSYSHSVPVRPFESVKISLMQEYDLNEISWAEAYQKIRNFVEDQLFNELNQQYARNRLKQVAT